jgi:hypothetical protein
MAGLHLISKDVASKELQFNLPKYGNLKEVTASAYYDMQDQWKLESSKCYSYDDFIKYFRDLRYKDGISDKQY